MCNRRCPRQLPLGRCLGFTLIELIAVVVLLAIVSVLSGGFMIQTANSYHRTVTRSKLVQTGRQAIEQMTRQLRIAVPNSLRVSANNLCIEWLPVVAGVNYLGELPDQSNGASAVSSIQSAPVSFDIGTARYVTVGALSNTELFNAAPGSLELFSAVVGGVPNTINLGSPKQFLRNSINQRLFIADHPHQFCISGGKLTFHQGYTAVGNYPSSSALTGTPPNSGVIIAQGVQPAAEIPFAVSNGTEERNAIVSLEIPFEQGGERIVLRHEVMVRNVP